jgi:site-specific recombinase XerD
MNKDGFIAYLQSINLAPKTIKDKITYVEEFFEKTKKEDVQVTKPDVLKYLEYLKNSKKVQNCTRMFSLKAIHDYFTFLCENQLITINPCWFLKIRGSQKKQLYKVYTPEELDELFDNYYQIFVRNFDSSSLQKTSAKKAILCRERNAVILSILINQGTNTSEIEKIKLDDIDLIKAKIKIHGRTRRNDRVIPLKASQMGVLMHYLQYTRPQLLEYYTEESNKLFLSLPAISQRKTNGGTMINAFLILSQQLKSIDNQFVNVIQLRTSVITNWLKTEGLRKTQYLAGHRYISSTEKYLSNNLDSLINDINKLHPLS